MITILMETIVYPTLAVDGDLSVRSQRCQLIGPLRLAEEGHLVDR